MLGSRLCGESHDHSFSLSSIKLRDVEVGLSLAGQRRLERLLRGIRQAWP